MTPPTPAQTIGPFFAVALDFPAPAHFNDEPGVLLEGVVRDGDGAPVGDALVELWDGHHLARCGTDAAGRYGVIVPEAASQLAVAVFARGLLGRLLTRCYFADDADPFLAAVPPERRGTLMAVATDNGFRFDITLQGDAETVFVAG